MQQLTRFNEHIRSNKIGSNVEKRPALEREEDRKDVKRPTKTNPYVSQPNTNRNQRPRVGSQKSRDKAPIATRKRPALIRSGFQKLPYCRDHVLRWY